MHLVESLMLAKEITTILPLFQPMIKSQFTESIDITTDFTITNRDIEAKDIKVTSAHTNGIGEVRFSLGEELNLYTDFNFENLDITNFFHFDKTKQISTSAILEEDDVVTIMKDNISDRFTDFSFLDTAKVTINFAAKEVTLNEVILQNASLNLAVYNGSIDIGKASFNIKNNQYATKVSLTGLNIKKTDNASFILATPQGAR